MLIIREVLNILDYFLKRFCKLKKLLYICTRN